MKPLVICHLASCRSTEGLGSLMYLASPLARIRNEVQVLLRDLPGCGEYRQKVKYRRLVK